MSERDEDEGEDGYGLKVFDEMSKRESLRDFKEKKIWRKWGRIGEEKRIIKKKSGKVLGRVK